MKIGGVVLVETGCRDCGTVLGIIEEIDEECHDEPMALIRITGVLPEHIKKRIAWVPQRMLKIKPYDA